MTLNQVRIKEYLEWYHVASEVLPNLIPSLSEEGVLKYVSQEDWLLFPLPTEVEKGQAVNRPDPHIDITLREPDKIQLGIRCNTLKSVEKLRNILEGYHKREKEQLLEQLKALDDAFITRVLSKHKDYNRKQAPIHETIFDARSNTINETTIAEIFKRVGEIRQRGIEKREERRMSFAPEAPVLELVTVSVPLEEAAFRSALAKMGSIMETCLRIKTPSEVKRERKRLAEAKSELVGFICPQCQTKFPLEKNQRPRFCPTCETWIQPFYRKRSSSSNPL